MESRHYNALRETVYHAVLPNGLHIYVLPKEAYGKQFALFAVRYGGMDLRYMGNDACWVDTPAGVAHFLEHKMFDTPDGSALRILAANGAAENAFTSPSMTAYYFESTHGFEANLRTLLSFVSVPYFTEEGVSKERGIIGQEIGMSEDEPDTEAYYQLLRCVYARHPIRVPVLGCAESISQITAETLYQCHDAFYRPGNMVLCVAGNVDPAVVEKIAREVLPEAESAAVETDIGEPETFDVVCAYAECKMAVSVPLFEVGFKGTPPEKGKILRQRLVAELACDVLFGPSAPLYSRLYEDGLINNSFDGLYDFVPGCAYLTVGGESRDPAKVREELLKEAARLVREGVDTALWERLKRAAYGSMVRRLNSLEDTCIELADAHFDGEAYLNFPELFQSIEWADVKSLLETWCVPERSALSVVWPLDDEE